MTPERLAEIRKRASRCGESTAARDRAELLAVGERLLALNYQRGYNSEELAIEVMTLKGEVAKHKAALRAVLDWVKDDRAEVTHLAGLLLRQAPWLFEEDSSGQR